VIASTAPARSKFQASACRQLPSPKSNKKVDMNMNMSVVLKLRAIKMNNGASGRIKTNGFS